MFFKDVSVLSVKMSQCGFYAMSALCLLAGCYKTADQNLSLVPTSVGPRASKHATTETGIIADSFVVAGTSIVCLSAFPGEVGACCRSFWR